MGVFFGGKKRKKGVCYFPQSGHRQNSFSRLLETDKTRSTTKFGNSDMTTIFHNNIDET